MPSLKFKEYIQNHQPILHESFRLAHDHNRLSHAYLLVGEPGTPLLKIARFIAKSILCDEDTGLACEECKTCSRIEANNYIDFITIDGKKTGTIKKEEITNLIGTFAQTAVERKGIQIYVINLVEIMRPEDEAVHALLKFLEEPHPNVYAILTTNNEERVIPTIISRCQVIPIRLRDRENVISESTSLGVPPKTAELMSKLFNDPDELLEVSINEKTSRLISAFDGFIDSMRKGRKSGIFYTQRDVIPLLRDKESARFYLDLLSEFFHELINLKNNLRLYLLNYDKILIELLRSFPNPEEGLYLILEARTKIEVNVTIPLILDHLTINLLKGLK